ncbi:MAG: DUF1297 domain-containing protein [Candidatus Micrarchaeota archaeon]|nr:DUF1297 domain-containing protein [Candidatus Micrarchaeota archaeon]
MIPRKLMQEMVSSYESLTVGVLGSHSALDICQGAKAEGIRNLVVCQKGREHTYEKYYRARKRFGKEIGVIDEIMLLDRFFEVASPQSVEELKRKSVIFIPHRSFSVYVGYDAIEDEFVVPIFGNRALLRAEERDAENNQLELLDKAHVRTPRRFKSPEQIDTVAIVKAPEAKRTYERAFFLASSNKEYMERASQMMKDGIISNEGLLSATIEEFVLGAQFNFNFFVSPLTGELELLGTDTRRQTNLDGLLRLPASHQSEALKHFTLKNIEVGHIACTIRESLLEKVFEAGEKFVETVEHEYPPGIIGPFALQGAITPEESGEEVVIFDVSFRVPGSPGTRFTPYTEYLHGTSLSVGRRIAMELKQARQEKRLADVVT